MRVVLRVSSRNSLMGTTKFSIMVREDEVFGFQVHIAPTSRYSASLPILLANKENTSSPQDTIVRKLGFSKRPAKNSLGPTSAHLNPPQPSNISNAGFPPFASTSARKAAASR